MNPGAPKPLPRPPLLPPLLRTTMALVFDLFKPADRAGAAWRNLLPVLALGLGAGFAAGHWHASADGEAPALASGSLSATEVLPLLRMAGTGDPGNAQAEAGELVLPAEQVQRWLQANGRQTRSPAQADERHRLLMELARTDPEAALSQAAQLRGDRRAQARSAVLQAWAGRDPQAALAWVRSQPGTVNATYDLLLETFGQRHPAQAMKLAQALSQAQPQFAQEYHLAALIGMAHQGRWAQSRRWAESANLPEADRRALVNFVAGAWGEHDPQAALSWVRSLPAEQQTAAMAGLGDSWAAQDPAAAARYAASQMADSPQRANLLRRALGQWLQEDPQQAGQWLASAANHADFDQAIGELATDDRLLRNQPGTALDWTSRISDPRLRQQARQHIVLALAADDPAAAAHWVQQIPDLSADERQQLLPAERR